ncbi:MAG: ankyrin repeat domain-containing protein [Clostridiales bacterium]|nr:ankyrin repeat domain-containing protein [Clostridiales bacterium]
MEDEEKLMLLKDRFTFSIYTICGTRIKVRNEAFINPTGSLIEQIDLFEYTKDDEQKAVDILNDLLDEVSLDEKAYDVLTCTGGTSRNTVDGVRKDIKGMFYKLQKNISDVSSSNNDGARKIEYARLQKGFRLIAQVLKDYDIDSDIIASSINTISDSSKHCMSNWKFTLIGLMINFEDQIRDMLSKKGVTIGKKRTIYDEEDKIYDLLLNAFYKAKRHVAYDLISKFIDEIDVYEEGVTHCKDVCTSFLNREYDMNLSQLEDVPEHLLSKELIFHIEKDFEKYIEKEEIYELIFDQAIKICMEDVKENPNKINQILNWFYVYLVESEMTQNSLDVCDFVEKYITRGEYNQELRYAAVKEMMMYYGFIETSSEEGMFFREERVLQSLLDININDQQAKDEFKQDVLSILRNDKDILIKFMSNSLVLKYNLFDRKDIEKTFDDKNNFTKWLLCSCECSNTMLVKYLIEKGVDVNVESGGDMPLMYACHYGNKDIVECLVEAGANVNQKDEKHRTPLIVACSRNHTDIVEYLLKKGAKVNEVGPLKWTALVIACSNNNMELILKLVESGANINVKSQEDCTALMYACEKNNLALVKYLIGHGAHVNRENTKGWTALMIACEKNNLKMIKYLVLQGADINKANAVGWTVLMMACEYNNIDIVKYLIECGAKVNRENYDGWTALLIASKNNNEDIVRFLVENGAFVDKKNTAQNTALMYACDNRNTKLAMYLIKHGARINSKNDKGFTPLIIACSNDNTELAMYLINCGANVNEKINEGGTALNIACRNNNEELIGCLIKNFASVADLDEENKMKIDSLLYQNRRVSSRSIVREISCVMEMRQKRKRKRSRNDYGGKDKQVKL